jgi:hypothetical protein
MKVIVVSGGVLSGLGKGITSSSIGTVLKARGLKVTAMKIDPYLNFDAGTLNPFEHGEVFVTGESAGHLTVVLIEALDCLVRCLEAKSVVRLLIPDPRVLDRHGDVEHDQQGQENEQAARYSARCKGEEHRSYRSPAKMYGILLPNLVLVLSLRKPT